MPRSSTWERYAWAAGIVFVAALLAESVVAVGVDLTHQDSATKIANGLQEHRRRLLVISYFSVVYAAAFVVYLWRLHDLLRAAAPERLRALSTLVLVGGVLFVSMHAVSDIGITGMLGAKVASYSAQHEPGLAYSLYLVTYAVDSVGDVFGSLFVFAAGTLIRRSGVLPRWMGSVALLVAILFFLQGFGLGGVIATFGLALDLVGFVLFLIFVLASSISMLRSGQRQDLKPAVAAV